MPIISEPPAVDGVQNWEELGDSRRPGLYRELARAPATRYNRTITEARSIVMDVVDHLQQATDGAASMIATLRPDELALPTLNEGWDVRAMLNHMIVVNKN